MKLTEKQIYNYYNCKGPIATLMVSDIANNIRHLNLHIATYGSPLEIGLAVHLDNEEIGIPEFKEYSITDYYIVTETGTTCLKYTKITDENAIIHLWLSGNRTKQLGG